MGKYFLSIEFRISNALEAALTFEKKSTRKIKQKWNQITVVIYACQRHSSVQQLSRRVGINSSINPPHYSLCR